MALARYAERHRADDAPTRRRREPMLGHLGQLCSDEPWVDAVSGERHAEVGDEPVDERRRGSERNEDR